MRATKAGIVNWGQPGSQDLRLTKILELVGIPYTFVDLSQEATLNARSSPGEMAFLVLAETIRRAGSASALGMPRIRDLLLSSRSALIHGLTPENLSADALKFLTNGWVAPAWTPARWEKPFRVSSEHRDICGHFSGLEIASSSEEKPPAILVARGGGCETLISRNSHALFVRLPIGSHEMFLLSSNEVVDVGQHLGANFNVRDIFLDLFPHLMFLRHMFPTACWQPGKRYASLIIDDPPLRSRHGFLNFARLLQAMDDAGFSSNIAFIPWNFKRTTLATAAMVRGRSDKWGLCFHGCDHTKAEFGSNDPEWLATLVALALRRMEVHQQRNGVVHERIMVFPQGVFSEQAMRVLKGFNFLAAVNTGIGALHRTDGSGTLPLSQLLSPAITAYGDFPLFARRKCSDEIANLAADIFLGKPCLIVCHHGDFRNGGRKLLQLISAIRQIAPDVEWADLGTVLRGSYLWRRHADGARWVKMFANEMTLSNAWDSQEPVRILKFQRDRSEVREVLVNGQRSGFDWDGTLLTIPIRLASQEEATVRVLFENPFAGVKKDMVFGYRIRASLRRYLCDIRDNYVDVGRYALQYIRQKTFG